MKHVKITAEFVVDLESEMDFIVDFLAAYNGWKNRCTSMAMKSELL